MIKEEPQQNPQETWLRSWQSLMLLSHDVFTQWERFIITAYGCHTHGPSRNKFQRSSSAASSLARHQAIREYETETKLGASRQVGKTPCQANAPPTQENSLRLVGLVRANLQWNVSKQRNGKCYAVYWTNEQRFKEAIQIKKTTSLRPAHDEKNPTARALIGRF